MEHHPTIHVYHTFTVNSTTKYVAHVQMCSKKNILKHYVMRSKSTE